MNASATIPDSDPAKHEEEVDMEEQGEGSEKEKEKEKEGEDDVKKKAEDVKGSQKKEQVGETGPIVWDDILAAKYFKMKHFEFGKIPELAPQE